jgi:hypothetical protein
LSHFVYPMGTDDDESRLVAGVGIDVLGAFYEQEV